MQISVVPLRNDLPAYFFKVSLTNVVYTIRARYNTRMQRWIIDIADSANNDIINGLAILLRTSLESQYVIPGLPAGALICEDNRNNIQEQPTRNSFGTTHSLLYVDPTQ